MLEDVVGDSLLRRWFAVSRLLFLSYRTTLEVAFDAIKRKVQYKRSQEIFCTPAVTHRLRSMVLLNIPFTRVIAKPPLRRDGA